MFKKLSAIMAIISLCLLAVGCSKKEKASEYIKGTSDSLGYQTVSVKEHFSYDIPQKWDVREQTATDDVIVLAHANEEKNEGMIISAYQADTNYDFSKPEDVKRYIDTSIKDENTYHVKNESISLIDGAAAEKVSLTIKSEDADLDAVYVLFNCDDGYAVISMVNAKDSDFKEKFDHIIESIQVN